jgi:hypothetical protein
VHLAASKADVEHQTGIAVVKDNNTVFAVQTPGTPAPVGGVFLFV